MPIWLTQPIVLIALVYALRVFGFMVILPALSLSPDHYVGADALHLGWAIGIYGLTQALCQVPMGTLSDRLGRKPIVLMGLLVLVAGSVLAACSEHIVWLIIARAIQGMGAVGSTLNAWAMDLTDPVHRPKVMAVIGVGIGASFVLSVALGPLLVSHLGLVGLFVLTACLALLAAWVVAFALPKPDRGGDQPLPLLSHLSKAVKQSGLLALNTGACCLHTLYTMLFMVIAPALREQVGDAVGLWFMGALLLALCLALPAIARSGRSTHSTSLLLVGIGVLVLNNVLGLSMGTSLSGLMVFLTLLWAAFTLLEALLPARIATLAGAEQKGAAMGLYAMFQYAGLYLGGVLGGWVYGHAGFFGVTSLALMVSLFWWVVAYRSDRVGL